MLAIDLPLLTQRVLLLTIGTLSIDGILASAGWAQSQTSRINWLPPHTAITDAAIIESSEPAVQSSLNPDSLNHNSHSHNSRDLNLAEQNFSNRNAPDLAAPKTLTQSEPAFISVELTPITTAHPETIGNVAQLEPQVEEQQEVEEKQDATVPIESGTIAEIQVRFIDRNGNVIDGNTQPEIITREFDLQPGDPYDSALAEQGLRRVIDLTAVQDASLQLESAAAPEQMILVVNVHEASSIAFVAGNQVARPSVLRGITLPRPTSTSPTRTAGFQLPGSVQWRNIGGSNQSLTFGVLAGNETGGIDLTFANPWVEGSDRIGYAVNINGLGYLNPTFKSDEEDVELPNGNADFWERRIGGGIQMVQRLRPDLAWAAGLSYQQISVRDSLLGDRLFTEDEFGNALVLSDDGIDSLLTLNAALVFDRRNDLVFPTAGSRLQLGIDQAIPVGDAGIIYTRPIGNFTQFMPLPFIQVAETPSTLLFNIQAGSLLGDAPPYEAFVLGGSSSVRGYGAGDVGSPQTFLQSSLEYRFPFASLTWGPGLLQELLGEEMLFAGNLFVDYATGFGTQSLITGEPGVVREKPGDGFGYGLGLLATSGFGLMRLELGISDRGDLSVSFTIGDRF